jgi:hypothetical protein
VRELKIKMNPPSRRQENKKNKIEPNLSFERQENEKIKLNRVLPFRGELVV